MSDEADKRVTQMHNIADSLGWDRRAMSLATEMRSFLQTNIADQGTAVDSGGADGDADLWVTVSGV